MLRRAALVLLAAVAAVPLVQVALPTSRVAADEGLRISSTTTYTVEPGVVRVVAELTLTNTTTDEVTPTGVRRFYFDQVTLPAPAGAVNATARTAGGRALPVQPQTAPGVDTFFLLQIRFGQELFSGQTIRIVVQYDLTGLPPRDPRPSRVNPAYVSFTAFGVGDPGLATVRVRVPSGFDVETFGAATTRSTENGYTVFTAVNIADADRFGLFVSARNDGALAYRGVPIRGTALFEVKSWPNDPEWADFVAATITDGVPVLEELVGVPWPIDFLVVRQAYTPYLYGYAGWFSAADREIEIGEDLDRDVVLHELSHAWFNTSLFADRWVNEGFAQVYAAMAGRRLGEDEQRADVIRPADRLFGLNEWGSPNFTSGADEAEGYGYAASWFVVEQLVDRVGVDGMRAVIAAAGDRAIAYRGDRPAETDPAGAAGWRQLLDLVEELGDEEVVDLFERYVVTADERAELDARAAARVEYAALVEAGAAWSAPLAVRQRMATWQFDDARHLIDAALAVLADRDRLAATSADVDVALPAALEERYESAADDAALDAAGQAVREQLAGAEALVAAVQAEQAGRGLFANIGLWGADLGADLAAGRAALAEGDATAASAAADRVIDRLGRAEAIGKERAVKAGGATLAAVLLGLGCVLVVRRVRRSRRLHGTHLDEDALAGAGEGGVDDGLLVARRHPGQAAAAAGVVQGNSELGDVGDPVLELHEHVGAVVEAQSVAGAQVLIDPHAHAGRTLPTAPDGRPPVPAGTLASMGPPVAPQRPHVWQRPTGPADDPWAWLRDADDPDTIAYLHAENQYADQWFASRSALVETLFEEIRSRVQETDLSAPVRKDGWWYVTRTEEGKSYPIHCRGRSADTATDAVLLDQNAEAAGHDYFSLSAFEVNHDHTLLAWSCDLDGSEQYTLRVRDLASGADLPDVIERTTWAGTAWSRDGRHLFYVTPDEQQRPYRVWRHELGADPSTDVLVFEEPDERFFVGVELTRSTDWIVIESHSKLSSEALLVPAADATATPVVVRPRTPDVEYSVDHWSDRFVVLTNLDAVDFRVMTAPLDRPGEWVELVPHVEGRRIVAAEPFAGHLVLHEWLDAQPRLRVLFTDGTERVIAVDDAPHDVELDTNPEWQATTVRYSHQSLTVPRTVYEEDVRTGERTLLKRTPVPNADLDRYVATREWAVAADGTRVPLDVVRRRAVVPDGTAPCVLYGYGSYEVSMAPWFSAARLSLLDRGVVWALAHPRGGGELGRRWYLDGKLLAKRNTFTDTIACAEHLVAAGWAAPGRLAIRGGSAGGLLVGACMNMRPDLFAAVVAEVPFVDVVTTMSDPTLPLTATEWEEWGDPRTEPFASYMASYSPYDNTAPGDHPALYVTAGLNDPRVSFHEPAKWVAKLRATGTGKRPVVFRCEMGAGHGGPSGRYDAWRDEARVLAFLLEVL